jgi:hypothetical protein
MLLRRAQESPFLCISITKANNAIHLSRHHLPLSLAQSLSGQVMASVTTSEGVSRAVDIVEEAISTGQPVL